ncbi:MAG: hypothetical protein KDE31_33435, partial [Caldilineaceae bacterium]|nr:hypothetical protein [Caldilineaceae bacterium]
RTGQGQGTTAIQFAGPNVPSPQFIQREAMGSGLDSTTVGAPMSTMDTAMNGASPPMASRSIDELEVERIADAVYAIIEQRLIVERERLGM